MPTQLLSNCFFLGFLRFKCGRFRCMLLGIYFTLCSLRLLNLGLIFLLSCFATTYMLCLLSLVHNSFILCSFFFHFFFSFQFWKLLLIDFQVYLCFLGHIQSVFFISVTMFLISSIFFWLSLRISVFHFHCPFALTHCTLFPLEPLAY